MLPRIHTKNTYLAEDNTVININNSPPGTIVNILLIEEGMHDSTTWKARINSDILRPATLVVVLNGYLKYIGGTIFNPLKVVVLCSKDYAESNRKYSEVLYK